MPEPLEEALTFDISGALQGIGQIDDALTQVVTQFQVGLASTLETLTSTGTDVPPLADTLDVAGLGPAIDTAITDATTNVDVPPLDVPVTADTTDTTAAVDAIAEQPVDVTVTADTTDAQSAIDALGQSATDAAGAGGAGGGVFGLSDAVTGFSGLAGAAEGNVSGLGNALGSFGPEAAGAAAAGTAYLGFLSETINLAADAQAQQQRFNTVFGASTSVVESINVGGLVTSLKDLGTQSGTTLQDLEASASKIGQLGTSSGVAQGEVAQVTQQILGLAATLSVQNPRLGDAATVADRLSTALTHGGRSAQQLGLDVPTKEIQALGQQIVGAGNEVTQFDKLQAGLSLALKGTGDSLGKSFAAGAQNAEIQLRALKTQLEETLVTVGQPLLQPAVESMTALTPVAQELGVALGEMAQSSVPIVNALIPALQGMAGALHAVGIAGSVISTANGTAIGTRALGVLTDTLAPPIGLMHNLGNALGFLHSSAKPAVDDLSNLSTQLQTVGSQSGNSLAPLGTSVDDLAKHFKDGSTQAQAFNGALIGLVQGGHADEAAKAMGLLTLQLEKQGKTAAEIGALFKPYFDALDATSTLNKAASDSVQSAGITTTAAAGGWLQLSAAIAAGKGPSLDAASVAQQLGVQAQDVTTFIGNQTTALNAQKDALLEASPAAAALVEQLQNGSISAQDAAAQFVNLGITVGGATTFVQGITKAMQDFITQGLAKLPAASAQLESFASGITGAYGEAVKAVQSGQDSIQQAQDALSKAERSAGQSAVNTAASHDATLANAEQRVRDAGAALAQAQSEGGDKQAAAIKHAQSQVDSANKSLTSAQQSAANAQASAVRSGNQQIAAAQDALAKAQADAAEKSKAATFAFLQAIDPQTLIDAEAKQTASIIKFQANVATLIQRGQLDVAAQLVAEGPVKGALTASLLVGAPEEAKALNSGIALANKTTDGYGQFLQQHSTELSGRLVTLANGQTVPLESAFSKLGGSAAGAFVGGISAQARSTLGKGADLFGLGQLFTLVQNNQQVKDAATAAAKAGNAAQTSFTSHFAPDTAASASIGKVPDAITSQQGAMDAAAQRAANDLVADFHPDFTGNTSRAILGILSAIDATVVGILPTVEAEGHLVGQTFVQGIIAGLKDEPALRAATAALAIALIPDLAASFRQIPTLAPAITAASLPAGTQGTAPPAAAPTAKTVSVKVDLHKVDPPSPKLLANEIAYLV